MRRTLPYPLPDLCHPHAARRIPRPRPTYPPASPPDRVWQLIGGFDSLLPDWLPYIPASDLSDGGRVRNLKNEDGSVIVERLEGFDNKGRTYSYSILRAPSP